MVAAGFEAITDVNGHFAFAGLEPGPTTVTFDRRAYAPVSTPWESTSEGRLLVTMSPRVVRALHVSGTTAANDSAWDEMLAIASSTAVNAMVIDVKTESGFVFAASSLAAVATNGANAPEQYDLAVRTAQAHANGLYVVVRIVSFQDPLAAREHHAWTAWDTATNAPYVKAGQWFLDPYDLDARQYALDLGIHACQQGVDEVQFDYLRFPSGDPDTVVYDGPNTDVGRQTTITSFMTEAGEAIHPLGCATAIDIFGFITNKPHEGGIGQQLELLTMVTDVVSPMTYPSLYSENWYGFSDPSLYPGPVVRNANQDALDRMQDTGAVLRPWLQDFSYTADQVEVQLVEADALGLGWMLWNVASEFTVAGIPNVTEMLTTEATPEPVFKLLPASGFYDVADSHRFATEIGWAHETGITVGCNPPYGDLFCGPQTLTRGQMSAFIARALELAAPEGANTFDDDDGSTFEDDIEAIATAGITVGCGDRSFCPDQPITRAQMATFLVNVLGLPPNDDHTRFVDDDGSIHEENIAAIAEAEITLGCALGQAHFCPQQAVTRAQMAAFLYRGELARVGPATLATEALVPLIRGRLGNRPQ